MSKKVLLIDGNSVGHAAQGVTKLSIGDMPVQAIYGFLRTLRTQVALYQIYNPVVLWDGVSWRNMTYPEYKENREKVETKHDEVLAKNRTEYRRQLPEIKRALRFLGIPQVMAANMEADDMAAIMVDQHVAAGNNVILLTGDRDWLQLIGPGVVWCDHRDNTLVSLKNFEEKTGCATPRQFVEAKALSGDAGDNIDGVGGIGMKGAVEFLKTYGSFNSFLNQAILEKPEWSKTLPKKYAALIEDEKKALIFERNMELMDLRTCLRPEVSNLMIDRGEPDKNRMRRFCELLMFKSIVDRFDDWIGVFPKFREVMA